MRTNLTFSLVAGLALALAAVTNGQSGNTANSTEPLILDLSKFHTEEFVTGDKTNACWATVVGRRVFDGVPFQVDGRACVYGSKLGAQKRNGTNTYPNLIGIQIGRKFDELHLLHVTQWADVEGREIARIRLNYADGSKYVFPIQFGGQVRDSHRMPSEEKELLTDPGTKVVWRGPGAARIKSTLRLFMSVLVNPYPEKEVLTMDVRSSKHLAGYDLIAATVANRDSSRPVTPPCPPDEPERTFDGTLIVQVTEKGSGKPVTGALVDPMMNVDDVSVIAIPFLTSATGEGVLRYPVGRTKFIWVSVEKKGLGTQRSSSNLEAGATNYLQVEMTAPLKITGVVRDGTGAPLAEVDVVLWPQWRASAKDVKTDANGKYVLTWNPQNQGNSDWELFLVARDLKRNLAFAQSVDEDTTNLDLRLDPGLTLAGRATGADGKALTNAEAEVMFWTRNMGASFGQAVRAGAEGRFEIKALPTGRRYGLYVSAKGYGRASHNIEEGAAGPRVELEPFELALADQCIAGVVLDADDKPVTNANIFGYGEGQPNINGKTDSKGRFSFKQVCSGSIRLQANTSNGAYGSTVADGGETNITVQLGSQAGSEPSRGALKITGTVTDPDGKPAPKVKVSVFPCYSQAEKQTDTGGRFTVTFDPNQFGQMGETVPTLVARDLARNLAAAVDLEEGATNINLRLEPALTLAGRITDTNGKAITNAQAHALFHTERMGTTLGTPIHADAEGRFEIKALPPGRQYSVNTSAKGFGQEQRDVAAADTQTNRLELEPFQLAFADQRIAGVVLDEDDKPVARTSVYSYGNKQPNINVQTDAKGHFTMDKVCAGPIELSANSRNGRYAHLKAEGGDTNIVIHMQNMRLAGVVNRAAPQTARLKGKPLPDLAPLGLTPAEAPANQPLLAVFIDAEQRPSRRAVRLLGEQAASLKEQGIAVVVVHTSTMADEDFKAWKQEAALPFPVGCLKGNAEKARAAWGASALPWLILTDKAHLVTAEGFELDELDAKLKALAN